jgi:hypothetical protein
MKKFLPIEVYRSASIGDCTNGGISACYDKLYVEHPNGCLSEDDIATELDRIVVLTKRHLFGQDVLSLKPLYQKCHSMFGGNFAYSCDSRITQIFGGNPVKIHDRVER